MAYQYWNRYSDFNINGEQTIVPFVNIAQKPTDKTFIYKVGRSRLDVVSQEFYNTHISRIRNCKILHRWRCQFSGYPEHPFQPTEIRVITISKSLVF